MKLTELFTGEKQIEATGKSQADIVRSDVVNRQIRSMIPGQTLQGEVISRNGSEVQIRLSEDIVLQARLDRNMNLEIGKNMTFEVKNNGRALTLSPLFTNVATDANVLKALDMAALPVNGTTVSMTKQLMEVGLSIDRTSLQQIFREVNLFPEAETADIVNLHKLQMPVNEGNIIQMASYRNLTHQLVTGLNHVLDVIPDTMAQMIESGNTDGAVKLYQQLLSLTGENVFTVEMTSGNEGMLLGSILSENGMAELDIAEGDTTEKGVTVPGVTDETGTQGVGIQEKPMQDETGQNVGVQNAGDQSAELQNTGVPDTGEQNAELQKSGVPDTGEQSTESQSAGVQNIVVQSAESQSTGVQNIVVQSAESQSTGMQDIVVQNAESQNTGMQNAGEQSVETQRTEELSSGMQNSNIQLANPKELLKPLLQMLKEQWTITPEEVADADKIDGLYRKLNRQLKDLAQTLEHTGQTSGTAYKAVTGLTQNLDFMQQMNQVYTYIQLPLRLQQGDAHGDLYVYTNKKHLAAKDGQISALLHLDMEHLGPVDVYVAMKQDKVNTKFYLQDDDMLDFLMGHMDILTKRLQKRGYQCNFEMQVREQKDAEENSIQKLLRQENHVPLAEYAFDVRT